MPNAAGTALLTLPNGTDTITYFRGDGNRIRRVRIAPDGLHFYVARDAGSIMEYTYTGVTLPVHFLKFDGKLIGSGIAELTWDAVIDQDHNYFEVERSFDGVNFISLGKSVVSPPYKFIDASMQAGNNYYRIKEVNKDGKATYSSEIKIVYDPAKAVITTYPNPVSSDLNIKVSTIKKDQLNILLTDITGKVMYRSTSSVDPGTNDLKIDMQKMSSQVYILTIRNNNSREVLLTEKLLKVQ